MKYRGLLVVISLYIALSLAWSITVPLFEAPDEVWHYPFVAHLARTWSLPIQDPDNPQLWLQEGNQPPLYYACSALLTWWIDTSDLPDVIVPNPLSGGGFAEPGPESWNKNRFLHGDWEDFPYHGTVLAMHLLRAVSTLIGSGAIICTYFLALEAWPERPLAAITAATYHAFLPQFVFVSSAVNNDTLTTLLFAWGLLLIARLLRRGITTRRLVGLGIVGGLAAISKLSGTLLIPLIGIALVIVARRQRSCHPVVKSAATVGALILLIAGWWYVRNVLLYGELTGTHTQLTIFGYREETLNLWELGAEVPAFFRSYWAAFGWGNILADPVVYEVGISLHLLGLAGLLSLAMRRRGPEVSAADEGHPRGDILALLGGALIIVLLPTLHWMRVTWPAGRHLYPALSAIAVLMGMGWVRLFSRRYAQIGILSLAVLMAGLTLFCLMRYVIPAFAKPLTDAAEVKQNSQPVHYNYGGEVALVGYKLDEEIVRPGDEVQLTLYWQAESETERNYKVFLHLTVLNHADQKVGQCDTLLGGTNYPTSLWHAGDLVRGEYTISLSPDAPTPRVYEVRVGLYNLESGAPLMEQELGYAPVLTRIWSSDAASSEPEPSVEVNFQLGDAVRLHGYNLELSSDGEELSLTLYWTTLGPMPADYHVFVHLVDVAGKLVAQRDAPPLGGEYPTSAWRAGERLVDTYKVKLSSVPTGSYTVHVGMYLLSSGERVPVYDENGTALSMRAIPLTQVQVVRKNDQ